jgi:CRP-like cAMP-binding protein
MGGRTAVDHCERRLDIELSPGHTLPVQEDTRSGLRATALLQSRMLEKLSDVQRGAVLAAGAARTLARREVLEHQGDPARTFYLVEAGYLKLTQLTAAGDEVVVRFVGPGEPYGGVVVLEHDTYPVAAQAVEHATVMGWSRDILRRLTDDVPQLRMNVVTEIAQHMRDALTRVQQLQTTRVGQRLAATLLHLARPHEGTMQIAHPITRQELAEMTGATLFTVSRTLSDWEARGWIATVQTHIRLLKPAHIERLVDE